MCEKCGVDHPMPEDLTFYQALNMIGELYTEMTGWINLLNNKAITQSEKELILKLQKSMDDVADSVDIFIDDFEEKEKQMRINLESIEE